MYQVISHQTHPGRYRIGNVEPDQKKPQMVQIV